MSSYFTNDLIMQLKLTKCTLNEQHWLLFLFLFLFFVVVS